MAWVGLGWVGVSHLWFGFEFGKFPIKMSNFSFVGYLRRESNPIRQDGNPASNQLDDPGPFGNLGKSEGVNVYGAL